MVGAGPNYPASKPVTGEFQPDATTNYDPFSELSEEDRKVALGGQDGATEYFELVARHLALALNDKRSREILHQSVPKWEDGEVKLAKIWVDNPHLLKTIAAGLRESVGNKGLQNTLASKILDASFDEQAMLRVAEAMFDLEVTLVTPTGKEWDSDEAIPVFFIPIDDEADLIEGVDSESNSVSLSADIDEAPYTLLSINFDEDAPLDESQAFYQGPVQPAHPLDRLWNFSLVSSVYAPSGCIRTGLFPSPNGPLSLAAPSEKGVFDTVDQDMYRPLPGGHRK